MLNRNQKKLPVTYHFGLKFLFDGYLTNLVENYTKLLKIKDSLFDSHLIKHTI
jgi:hypothetical protein